MRSGHCRGDEPNVSNLRQLDLRLLASLEVLLETRNVSRAAERLSVSQPAMSRILARLRDQFGDPLLVRGRSGMVLTPRAEALRAPLAHWLSQGEAMLHPPAFDPLLLNRRFRVASTDFGIISVITPAMNTIHRASPGSSLAVEPLSTASLSLLAEGRLDVVVTGYRPEGSGLHSHRLFSEHHLGIARADHPADLQALGLDEFLSWPHVVAIVGAGYGDGLGDVLSDMSQRRVLASAASFSTIPYLVAESDALAILPSRAAERFGAVHGHQVFKLPVHPPTFHYYLVWHERSVDDAPTSWLLQQLSASHGEAEGDRLNQSAG
ncbi:LysR family transcriptional regulator [Brevundimonas intermedia]|uniref:LysR family transcriptional regulator n=1 Tax=Brevundimonas intermedia TaxID=74315 RepID=UPI00320A5305